MHIPQIREALSWVPLKLKPSLNGIELSVATGFFYQYNDRTFLITNYHVVSGRHPDTGSTLHSGGMCPDSLVLGVPANAGVHEQSGAQLLQWRWHTLSLYRDDGVEKPVW